MDGSRPLPMQSAPTERLALLAVTLLLHGAMLALFLASGPQPPAPVTSAARATLLSAAPPASPVILVHLG